ncbi:MAG: hypothetical protein AAFO89_03315, partial [Planctomycetota bacterium]
MLQWTFFALVRLLLLVLAISVVGTAVMTAVAAGLGLIGMMATFAVGGFASGLVVGAKSLLSHPRLARNVRVFSVLLIIIAFHFDFLASSSMRCSTFRP